MKQDLILSAIVTAMLLVIIASQSIVGDSGDSVLHFLYAKEAFTRPVLFLDHWAKPIFTLIAAPFAQFGFKGIMVFNALLVGGIVFLSQGFARSKGWRHRWLIPVFLLTAPLFFRLTFSGLTEYLFAFGVVLALWFAERDRMMSSAIVISFLPFVRSEGLILIGVWALWLMIRKHWKALPWLLAGNVIYALIGFPHYGSLFWIFTKVPYAALSSPYGSGAFFDFFHRLNYVIEKVNYLLLVFGLLTVGISFFMSNVKKWVKSTTTLIWASFLSYFIAHGIFWHLGIFNSMGLPRVLIAVVPMVALLELRGLDWLLTATQIPDKVKAFLPHFLAVACVGFLFLPRPQGVLVGPGMFQVPEHLLIQDEVAPYIKSSKAFASDQPIAYNHPYLAIALDHGYFNPAHHVVANPETLNSLPTQSLAVIDSWFSVVEGGVDIDSLNTSGWKRIKTFESVESPHRFELWVKQ